MKFNEKELELLKACLTSIKLEMDRVYWNNNQEEMNSPFLNSGEVYYGHNFNVRAYDWGNPDSLPNFEYRNLEVYWYKHYKRGLTANFIDVPPTNTPLFLEEMLWECLQELRSKDQN